MAANEQNYLESTAAKWTAIEEAGRERTAGSSFSTIIATKEKYMVIY